MRHTRKRLRLLATLALLLFLPAAVSSQVVMGPSNLLATVNTWPLEQTFAEITVTGTSSLTGVASFDSQADLTAGAISNGAIFGGETTAILQLGADVNGAAVAQTLKAHDGITGTDVAGANLTIAGGRGTGAGAPGDLRAQTAVRLATGTTAQTLADRELIVGGSATLTAAGADSFVEIAVAQGSVTGAIIEYTIRADDGTDFQARTGAVMIVAANKAGTETCTIARLDGGATVDNTTDAHVETAALADMTNVFTCVTGLTDVVRVAANAAATGIVETTLNITYTVRKNGGAGAITPIP